MLGRKICAKPKEINGVTDETGATTTIGASSRAEYKKVTPAEDAIPDRVRKASAFLGALRSFSKLLIERPVSMIKPENRPIVAITDGGAISVTSCFAKYWLDPYAVAAIKANTMPIVAGFWSIRSFNKLVMLFAASGSSHQSNASEDT
jgi:hypothetical protein